MERGGKLIYYITGVYSKKSIPTFLSPERDRSFWQDPKQTEDESVDFSLTAGWGKKNPHRGNQGF